MVNAFASQNFRALASIDVASEYKLQKHISFGDLKNM